MCLQLKGTAKGIPFVYFGYYFSNSGGTTQLVCFTTMALLKDQKSEMELFLNGLVTVGNRD